MSACGRTPCGEHGTLCAYHGDEPDRCPWCHSLWSVIIARVARWADERLHSCERPHIGRRIEQAKLLRLNASEKPYSGIRSTHCTHQWSPQGNPPNALRSRPMVPQGVAAL